MYDLVVTSPVAGKQPGERISDPALIAEILADERHAHVVKVARETLEPAAAAAEDHAEADAEPAGTEADAPTGA